jgi:Right handed beta helix region
LHIEADGEIDSFTKKPKPYVLAVVKAIEGNTILLKQPLKFPVPAKAFIRHADAPNLIEVRGASEGVRIEKLTLDGGRIDADPPVRGHAQLCGVFAAGPYSYEKGPTGPRVKDIAVARCIIRNCHGRGVALYSAEAPTVEDCTIMDTTDEAIDLDHFTIKAVVRHNHIARSLIGVELNDANDCIVSANEFRHCKTGINLWRWCKQPGLNEGNRIENNLFEDTAGNAIQIATGTARNSVIENEIIRSGRNGITLAGAGQIVKGNTISASKLKDLAINEGEHAIK